MLRALGPAGLAAAAGLGATLALVSQGVRAFAELEQATARLEAVFRATGQASGVTAGEVDRFARDLARATLTSRQEVIAAAGALASFRGIGREAFFDLLRLAQDLGAVFGGDLLSNTRLLARALEDPEQGLSRLERAGIAFGTAQREAVRAMAQAGDQAGAQRLILEQLERSVGGAGTGTGLTGATDSLREAWGDLLIEIGRTPWIVGTAETAIEALTQSLDGMRLWFAERPVSVEDLAAARTAAEAAAAAWREAHAAARAAPDDLALDNLAIRAEMRYRQAREHLDGLMARLADQRDREQREDLARAAAAEGERLAREERLADRLAGIARQAADERSRIETDARRQLIDGFERDMARIRALAEQGAPTDAVRRALAEREALHRAQLAEMDAAAQASEERRAEAAARAAEAAAGSRRQAIAALARELELLSIADAAERERARFVAQATDRLRGATAQEIAQARALAAALFDLRREREAEAETRRIASQALARTAQDYRALIERQGGAVAQLGRWRQETLAHAEALGLQGAALAEVVRQVEALHAERLPAARREDLRSSDDWRDGLLLAFERIAGEGETTARTVERAMLGAFDAIDDALARSALRGRLEWRSMLDGMALDLARTMSRDYITGPIGGALGGLVGGVLAGLFHDGGGADAPRHLRAVPAETFAGAPRLHRGSLPWLAPGEVPAILDRREIVLSPDQSDALRRGAAETRRPTLSIQVDARGAGDPAAVEAAAEAAVERALARHLPDLVRVTGQAARDGVIDRWQRQGGRFG